MEAIRISEKLETISWKYDQEADVLCYDEKLKEVVGLTLIGLRARLLKELTSCRSNVRHA
ncbi:MAG: hypothetical protein ACUVWR_15145 [Anaerolineae bacterium]